MDKWEFKHISVDSDAFSHDYFMSKVAEEGSDEWELVNVVHKQWEYIAYFKRKIINDLNNKLENKDERN